MITTTTASTAVEHTQPRHEPLNRISSSYREIYFRHFCTPMHSFMIMKAYASLSAAGAVLLHLSGASAQQVGTCSNVLKPSYSAPVVGTGWIAQLVATGLTKPRSIIWDNNGHLLVVQQGVGIQRLTFRDNGTTCLEVADSSPVIENSDVSSYHQIISVIWARC